MYMLLGSIFVILDRLVGKKEKNAGAVIYQMKPLQNVTD